MTQKPRQIFTRTAARPRHRRRRLIALVLVLAAIVAAAVWLAARIASGSSHDGPAGSVTVMVGQRPVANGEVSELSGLSDVELLRWLDRRLPAERVVQRGRAHITLRRDGRALVAQIKHQVAEQGGQVQVTETPIAARIRLPIAKQALRNNCETASLSMLLRTRNVHEGQLSLQRKLPRSGPADPRPSQAGGLATWGDPQRGFVGRAEGGGASGGYGVYERPVKRLALTQGVALNDLTRRSPARIYDALLAGQPVMVWVGLTNGPFKTWKAPSGQRVRANFGEHAVVLTGLRGSTVFVNDPLSGTRITWKRAQFELMWQRLGRRALAA